MCPVLTDQIPLEENVKTVRVILQAGKKHIIMLL